jgi:hypothetical protein
VGIRRLGINPGDFFETLVFRTTPEEEKNDAKM